MFAHELVEVLSAAHLTYLVESPFEERGGIMLVGPPAALKSTFLNELDRQYADALSLSDLNAKALVALRDRVASGVIHTLVFPEYAKIYERKDDTSANLEGSIRALTAEGFSAAAFEDASVNRVRARAMVIGAMTPSTQSKRFEQWEASGFNRRFLWSLIRLENPHVLEQAVVDWHRLKFQFVHLPQAPAFGAKIPNATTREERELIRRWVKYQPGGSAVQHTQTLTKVLAVLRWWYHEVDDGREPIDTVMSFAESLGREGAMLQLTPPSRAVRRRVIEKERRQRTSAAARVLANAKRKGKGKRNRPPALFFRGVGKPSQLKPFGGTIRHDPPL